MGLIAAFLIRESEFPQSSTIQSLTSVVCTQCVCAQYNGMMSINFARTEGNDNGSDDDNESNSTDDDDGA